MYDKSDILLINTHAKGDRRYYDLYLISHPSLLDVLPAVVSDLRMVVVTLNSVISFQDLS